MLEKETTTFREGRLGDLPFWDEAAPGQLCMVPCWPTDSNGNAVDCFEEIVLVGVIGADGYFRNAEWTFRPAVATWRCVQH